MTISGSDGVNSHLDEMNQSYTQVCHDVCTTLEGGLSALDDHGKAEKAGLVGVQSRVSRLLEQQIQVRPYCCLTPTYCWVTNTLFLLLVRPNNEQDAKEAQL